MAMTSSDFEMTEQQKAWVLLVASFFPLLTQVVTKKITLSADIKHGHQILTICVIQSSQPSRQRSDVFPGSQIMIVKLLNFESMSTPRDIALMIAILNRLKTSSETLGVLVVSVCRVDWEDVRPGRELLYTSPSSVERRHGGSDGGF
jgi:hypothetical protein